MTPSNYVTVVLRDYDSKYFPVRVDVKTRGYNNVFQTTEEAKRACEGRFGKCRFLDRTTSR